MKHVERNELESYLAENSIAALGSDKDRDFQNPSWMAHSYIFHLNDTTYIVDPSISGTRFREIVSHLSSDSNVAVLNTHHHHDHTDNNNALIAHCNCPTYMHDAGRRPYVNIRKYYHWSMVTMIRCMGARRVLHRVLSLNNNTARWLSFPVRLFPRTAARLLIALAYRHGKRRKRSVSGMQLLHPRYMKSFDFNGVLFPGWNIQDSLYALYTPGHSSDSVSWYCADERKALFIGDADLFLSPNGLLGSIHEIDATIERLLALVEAEKIRFLGPGHYTPVTGTENILNYLKEFRQRQRKVRIDIEHIVARKTRWFWEDLMYEIENSTSRCLQEVVSRNYPRGENYIDIFVYLLLRDHGFRFRRGAWVQIKEPIQPASLFDDTDEC